MNARRRSILTGLVVTATLGACSSPSARVQDPVLPHRDGEAPVAVTVPSGPEAMPTWQRQGGRATVAIPADLLFSKDSADVGPAAVGVLGQVVAEARSRPGSAPTVLVEGYADGDGDAGHNQELSERRAAAVGEWLSSNGLDSSTITTHGWGETRPAVDEIDDAAKAANRRVVVTVTFPASAASAFPSRTRRPR